MITFTNLRYKNFLSTGDAFTEIPLNKAPTTLIVGQNGAGKSTMLDALSFALFGKAHRNITKGQLINSINNKNSVVEVEFDALGQKFKIIRGIKPAIFEIWRDNTLINQDSHAKEYQKILEQNILKLNHKTFHQIVVLGSSSFIPFMQLPSQHRRDVIEDLLDINIFSKMNGILKERSSVLRESITMNKHELDLVQTKIESQKKHILELEKISDSAKQNIAEKIAEKENELTGLTGKFTDDLTQSLSTLQSGLDDRSSKVESKIQELGRYVFQFNSKQKKTKKDIDFYGNTEECPTCQQDIEHTFRLDKVQNAKEKWEELETARKQANTQSSTLIEERDVIKEEILDCRKQLEDIVSNNQRMDWIRQSITNLQVELGTTHMVGSQDARTLLEDLDGQKDVITESRLELADQREYHNIITELLKDTGIKTKIIKQYLPVINKLTNQYLQVLDFYVSFDLDESFKETIRSRHRDAFSYDSFSEGEKQRIDLALLFTWRQVAKMKNSIATNLLILDETFDSSLDADGVDNLSKILETLSDDSNVFVISHKGELLDNKFEDKIEFVKKKNFSQILT